MEGGASVSGFALLLMLLATILVLLSSVVFLKIRRRWNGRGAWLAFGCGFAALAVGAAPFATRIASGDIDGGLLWEAVSAAVFVFALTCFLLGGVLATALVFLKNRRGG